MDIRIEPITGENRVQALALHVGPGQEGFVESVEECLLEASGHAAWRPVLIRHGDEAIGFAMYGFFDDYPPCGRLWMDRLLIGDAYQGKGYGHAAMDALLGRLEAEYGAQDVYLSVVPGNEGALRLYAAYGFVGNGEKDVHDENVMVRKVRKRR